MSLSIVLSLMICLLVIGTVWLGLRRRTVDPAPFDALRRHMEDLASRNRVESQQALVAHLRPLMAELGSLRSAQAEKLGEGFRLLGSATQDALRASREEQAAQLNQVQQQVEKRLESIQASNDLRLEQMRRTVDEKLHETLEKRLGESFNLVAQRLEQVQKGLGEMQSLAQDVGGLKRALTNVKTRGVLGEAQLGALLEQFLSAGQYATNVRIRPRSPEVVE
jgi:DNA recombination protein RmuC